MKRTLALPRRVFLAGSATLAIGCAASRSSSVGSGAPHRYTVRASQYAVSSDFEMRSDDPLLGDLSGLRDAVADELALPPGRTPIRVLLFQSESEYVAYLSRNYPELPPRRAFFVQHGERDLAVLAWRGDELRRDLRHEATHALLHGILPSVPLWLDEGLAEYFELGPNRRSGNARHAQMLLREFASGGRPELRRLERLTDLARFRGPEYRESWLWVHALLNYTSTGRTCLRMHLQALRGGTNDSLASRLEAAGVLASFDWRWILDQVAPADGVSDGNSYPHPPAHRMRWAK